MPKFRKRPVVVDAHQWMPGIEISGVREFGPTDNFPAGHGIVKTLEGNMVVTPGDWVITGVKGEKYPCKPDIFEMTYELVS